MFVSATLPQRDHPNRYIGHAPEPIPVPIMPEDTRCIWPEALWNLALLLLIHFISECIQRQVVAGHGDAGIIGFGRDGFSVFGGAFAGPVSSPIRNRLQKCPYRWPGRESIICVSSVRVQHIQLLRTPMHNPCVGSSICYMCAMMWRFRARMCDNWMCCMRLGFSRVVFIVLESDRSCSRNMYRCPSCWCMCALCVFTHRFVICPRVVRRAA